MHTPSSSEIAESRAHLLVVGKTGAGKSTLLRTLLASEIAAGRGTMLLDPHGDLALEVRALLPRRRRDALVWVDPTEPSCPGMNPFARVREDERALAVSNLLAGFRKLFGDGAWGFRSAHLLRNAFLALMEVRGATLDDAGRMLFDERHRTWALAQVKDTAVRRFFFEELPSYGKLGGEAAAAPLNKLGAILGDARVRAVVTKSRPRLDVARAVERERVVLARLPKGVLGEDSVTVLGAVMLGALQAAIMRRASAAPETRHRFTLVVDELGCFPPEVPLELMAEGRKYGLRVVVCTQSVSALEPRIRSALLANAGLVAFRVAGEDAELLRAEFANEYGAASLTSLDVGEAVVRLGPEPARLVRFAA
jgi:energy-coupling factor transporter ATP-binding protein EcfA2